MALRCSLACAAAAGHLLRNSCKTRGKHCHPLLNSVSLRLSNAIYYVFLGSVTFLAVQPRKCAVGSHESVSSSAPTLLLGRNRASTCIAINTPPNRIFGIRQLLLATAYRNIGNKILTKRKSGCQPRFQSVVSSTLDEWFHANRLAHHRR